MSEVSTARKLEYRKFSDQAKKFQDLKSALRAATDVQKYQKEIDECENEIKELEKEIEEKDVTEEKKMAKHEKIEDLKEKNLKLKDLEDKISGLSMDVYLKINDHSLGLRAKYLASGNFDELDSKELWHMIIGSSPGWECELDVKGEDSIRLFLIKQLKEVNEKRKELGLEEIKLSDDIIKLRPEDLADLDLPESEIEKLF
jgi:hypothetical protein